MIQIPFIKDASCVQKIEKIKTIAVTGINLRWNPDKSCFHVLRGSKQEIIGNVSLGFVERVVTYQSYLPDSGIFDGR